MTEVTSRRLPGTPCWASLMAHRADRAQQFYGSLFGWKFVPGPEQLGAYMLAERDGQRIAGIGEGSPEPHRPVSWTTLLASDDVDHTAELVRECGGTVGIGPLQAADEGRLALAVDPSGAVFGIWQGGLLGGAEITHEPGTVAWSELVTRDSTLVTKFYEVVFGLRAGAAADAPVDHGEDDTDRVVLSVEGRPVAGIHGVGGRLPREVGAHWMTYFAVADTDDAVRRVVELGGQVRESPRDSARGRVATVVDPEGAAFSVVATAG